MHSSLDCFLYYSLGTRKANSFGKITERGHKLKLGSELAWAVGQIKAGKNKQIKVDINTWVSTCQFATKNQTLANTDSLLTS